MLPRLAAPKCECSETATLRVSTRKGHGFYRRMHIGQADRTFGVI